MPVKLLAMDIDGTLLDSQWKLPEANRTAIAEAVDRGIEVLLVTGTAIRFRPAGRGRTGLRSAADRQQWRAN